MSLSTKVYMQSAVLGHTRELLSRPRVASPARRIVTVRAQHREASRRSALGLLAAGAALLTPASPSHAAYGESANIFGRVANNAGSVPYAGEGYALLLPAKWCPSKELDFPGVALRYEDNFDPVTNLTVMVMKTDKSSVTGWGSPEKFLDQHRYLLGEQVFVGETQSEGGFDKDKVSNAALLDMQEATDQSGKTYYKYEILTRTADGSLGGRHYLITASVGAGNKLYVMKVQAGDKRWNKGTDKAAMAAWNSFTVA
jgi:hypothetical protein